MNICIVLIYRILIPTVTFPLFLPLSYCSSSHTNIIHTFLFPFFSPPFFYSILLLLTLLPHSIVLFF
eukprot:UN02328